MTQKVYKSAMGKPIDLGSLMLQNENTRAVGNMNVNARGDLLDSSNKVIDRKNRQVQRQYQRTTNVSADTPVQTSIRAKQNTVKPVTDISADEEAMLAEFDANEPAPQTVATPEPVADPIVAETESQTVFGPTGEGGLAAAIARSRLIKQEKEKTLREKQQAQGIRKI